MIALLLALLAAYFIATLYMYVSMLDRIEKLEEKIDDLLSNP